MVKDGTVFMLYERKKFENMSNRKYEYINGMNGHFEIALCVDTFEEADKQFTEVVSKGATPVLESVTMKLGGKEHVILLITKVT